MKRFSFPLRYGAIFGAVVLPFASTRGEAPKTAAPKVAVKSAMTKSAAKEKPYRVTHRVTLSDTQIDESSGLCRSVRNDGYLWTHNDSGGSARMFLLDESGDTRAAASLEGAKNIDWEDCATGTHDKSGVWIYAGDIGDNEAKRPSITIYRFREPALPASTRAAFLRTRSVSEGVSQLPHAVTSNIEKVTSANARVLAAQKGVNADAPQLRVSCEAMTLRYPDGAHDAETLMIAPDNRVLIVTKSLTGSEIFISPQSFKNGATQTLRKISERQFTDGGFFGFLATGGDLSADGTRLAIRTYTRVYEWRRDAKDNSDAAWRALFRRAPQAFDAPETRQGEALCYDARGALFFSSEKIPTPLIEMQR